MITARNLLCIFSLHSVCKTCQCKSLNKCPQNRTLPLDSALGKTSRPKTGFATCPGKRAAKLGHPSASGQFVSQDFLPPQEG